MAKKQEKLKSASAYPYSYPRVYSLVLWNTGEGDYGSTFSVLRSLVENEIHRIDMGQTHDSQLKSLLIIRDQLDEEFSKGRNE